jgi:hypothetical protein
MPNAQTVGFLSDRLDYLVSKVVPASGIIQRNYFCDRVLEHTEKQLAQSNKRLEMILPLHASLPKECISNGKGIICGDPILGQRYIPLYSVFLVVCDMWKKVPPEAKGVFGDKGSQADHLKELNDIYDDDNAQMKRHNTLIKNAEGELNENQALTLRLDKQKRRLERKWANGVANADELMLLQVCYVMFQLS